MRIYTSGDNVMRLLPLIEEYDISALKTKCEDVIATYEPSLDVLLVAHEYNMPRLLETATEACASLPLAAIDHKRNSELADHIPQLIIMDVYR